MINPHLFHHSFSRNALSAGMDIRRVSQMLGHSSIKTTVDVNGTPSLDETQMDDCGSKCSSAKVVPHHVDFT
ncbi:MAG: hypothetical protein A2Z21_07565 [Candidatus Fraserbacteria bacterium RBG_16_55_9]|uniref:Tyr recombinase domain-containing protein n=1 Tax=Fraserbacteria sp. (strain RBG_16_55_9) TaxID=1817864 RepID=A0A1F5UQX3_FRAXR|nr:MAG: hypothetical protein A2Z21_07565 [Candidatus Fraserbacteria bacterium RBG_16_55_9]